MAIVEDLTITLDLTTRLAAKTNLQQPAQISPNESLTELRSRPRTTEAEAKKSFAAASALMRVGIQPAWKFALLSATPRESLYTHISVRVSH